MKTNAYDALENVNETVFLLKEEKVKTIVVTDAPSCRSAQNPVMIDSKM